MSDKVQLIKQEIEKQIELGKEKCIKSQESNDYESLIAWSEHIATCGKLLVFINSLPKEFANEDLEKEIDEEIDNLCELGCYMEDLAKGNSEGVYPLPDNIVKELRKFARHFTEWQKEQDYKMYAHVPLKDIHDAWQELKKNKPDIENYPAVCFQKGADWRENHMKESLQVEYEKGRFDIREEMMKDAMEGEYWDGSIYLDNRPTKYEDGDEVKIIIIKEE